MNPFSTVRQLAIATRMLLVESTRELGLLLGFTIIFPLGLLFFLNLLVAPELRVQVLIGTIMMEMALLNVNSLAQTIGADKESKIFDLWVSLPISPVVYALSVALTFLPFTLLSAAVTLAVAVAVFHVPVGLGTVGLLLAGFVLVWASTLGVGFLIGVYGRSPRQINSWAQLIGVLLTFFVPVFYPATLLPLPLRLVAYAWPLTWGSEFLVAVVHRATPTALLAGGVLAGYIVLWFLLIARGLRWRER